MSCHEMPLVEFLRNELDDIQFETVLRHADSCPDCRERLQVIAGLEAAYGTPEAGEHRTRGSRILALAATALLAIALPFFFWTSSGPAELATKEKYPHFPLQTRSQPPQSEQSSTTEVRARAFAAYRAGNFPEAELWFAKAPEEADLLFYRGVTRYFLDRHSDALRDLARAAALDPNWRSASLWYQTNVYLKLNDQANAIQRLAKLSSQSGGQYQKRAEQLLRRLK